MGYGIVDIWIREAKCFRPAYEADWVVSIKDCLGRTPRGYRASGNAWEEIEDEDDPTQGLGNWEPTNCLNIHAGKKAHAMVKVPPGCYVVDAWDRRWGYNAHETMVVVCCGERACVNLLAGVRGSDVVPLIVRAREARINQDRINLVVNTVLETLRAVPQARADMPEEEYDCLLKTTEKEIIPQIKRLKPLLTGEEPPCVKVGETKG
jgi:hypothetical protein